MSAYDLLPECDRKAISLALDCGGVEEIKKRLMPAGMEWPRFDDWEPVRPGDEFADGLGGTRVCTSVEFLAYEEGVRDVLIHWDGDDPDNAMLVCMASGERVRRPAPKVLDADGAEIREKRDVWWICEGDERGVHAERLRVENIGPNGLIECSPYNGGTWVYLEPSELYVNEPVPASDGRPLREGETVWDTNGDELVIVALEDGGHTVTCRYVDVGDAIPVHGTWSPSQLTHERPVVDTWERLAEDARSCTCVMEAIDLVRRAKKLAGVGE